MTKTKRLVYGLHVKKPRKLTETQKAARLLGRKGGKATLEKHGLDKLREWAKNGGRREKPWDELSESGKRARRRREKLRRGEQ